MVNYSDNDRGHHQQLSNDNEAARPISSDWLSLRRPADEAARQTSLPMIAELQRFLEESQPSDDSRHQIRIFDLGAGTGANQAWLAPVLARSLPRQLQHWTLIDHDAALLEHTLGADALEGVGETRAVVAGIEDLGDLLGIETDESARRFVTCSALLDLLTPVQLEVLCAALVESTSAALFSLTVTGVMTISPEDPMDGPLNDTFNRHQNRGGRAGAASVDLTVQLLADAGFTVRTLDTPWELDSDHAELITRFLSDRADAILEEDPSLAADVSSWLARRTEQTAAGSLRLTVGHRDLLALPPRQ